MSKIDESALKSAENSIKGMHWDVVLPRDIIEAYEAAKVGQGGDWTMDDINTPKPEQRTCPWCGTEQCLCTKPEQGDEGAAFVNMYSSLHDPLVAWYRSQGCNDFDAITNMENHCAEIADGFRHQTSRENELVGVMREAQKQFEHAWKSHFGRDEFLQKDDGFYTSENTATAYFWFEKGLGEPRFASHESAASKWHDYDPENPSDELEDGCWHLLETADGWIETSRYCNQRHWIDCDTAVVKRFARVWI